MEPRDSQVGRPIVDNYANSSRYRKSSDEHPYSRIAFGENGFRHDMKKDRIRLAKGRNLKEHWSHIVPAKSKLNQM